MARSSHRPFNRVHLVELARLLREPLLHAGRHGHTVQAARTSAHEAAALGVLCERMSSQGVGAEAAHRGEPVLHDAGGWGRDGDAAPAAAPHGRRRGTARALRGVLACRPGLSQRLHRGRAVPRSAWANSRSGLRRGATTAAAAKRRRRCCRRSNSSTRRSPPPSPPRRLRRPRRLSRSRSRSNNSSSAAWQQPEELCACDAGRVGCSAAAPQRRSAAALAAAATPATAAALVYLLLERRESQRRSAAALAAAASSSPA